MKNYSYTSYQKQTHCEEFKVIIDEGEKYQIEKWVLMRDNIETGGDLFGLWIDEHTAVVQFVLGPGEGCRRTATSFYQDVNYLENAGKYLTKNHGLCNIGQWHSHHRLRLSRPSGGDENTVWGNMPNLRLHRYVVFIATIEGDRKNPATEASLNCFLFETDKRGKKHPVLKGKFEILKGHNSPFRLDGMILNKIKNGAEIRLNETKTFEVENKKTTKISTRKIVPVRPAIVGEKLFFMLERPRNVFKLKRIPLQK